ncbi:MAG: sugar kinase [Rhodobacteraceae bacterium]|nr:sugar kinase [Paracoccaceae bacterium]
MSRLLGIGECMVELSACGDGRYRLGFAGDTFNSVWYARQLVGSSLETAYLTAIGDDIYSARMARFIKDQGIIPELTICAGGSVGLYLITLRDGEREFSYWRGDSAARRLADGLETLPGIGDGDLVYFSGITLAILPEAGRNRLIAAIRQARRTGSGVAFDPNIRRRLWSDCAQMRRWIMAGAAAAEIVLPSFADEAACFGDQNPRKTAERYMNEGAKLVVVKDGAGPVYVQSAAEAFTVQPDPVAEVIDSTAAGDSFNAGALVTLHQGGGEEAAVRAGCAVARQVITASGALVPVEPELNFPAASGRKR